MNLLDLIIWIESLMGYSQKMPHQETRESQPAQESQKPAKSAITGPYAEEAWELAQLVNGYINRERGKVGGNID